MIRQLPRLSLPSFLSSTDSASDVKIYDIITDATAHNSEGNAMQLTLF